MSLDFWKVFYGQIKINLSYLGKRSKLESGKNMEKSFKICRKRHIPKIEKHSGGNIMV